MARKKKSKTERKSPAHLGRLASDQWEQVLAAIREERGELPATHLPALELFCVVYARWRIAEAEVEKLGAAVADGDRLVVNPYFQAAQQSAALLDRLITQLGLSPAAARKVFALVDPPLADGGGPNPLKRLRVVG